MYCHSTSYSAKNLKYEPGLPLPKDKSVLRKIHDLPTFIAGLLGPSRSSSLVYSAQQHALENPVKLNT